MTTKRSKPAAREATARAMDRLWSAKGEDLPRFLDQGIATIDRLVTGRTRIYSQGWCNDLVNLLGQRHGLAARRDWAAARARGESPPDIPGEPSADELREQSKSALGHGVVARIIRGLIQGAVLKRQLQACAKTDMDARINAYGAANLFRAGLAEHEEAIADLEDHAAAIGSDLDRLARLEADTLARFRAAAGGLVAEIGAEAIAEGLVKLRGLEDKSKVDPSILADLKREHTEAVRKLAGLPPESHGVAEKALKDRYATRIAFEEEQMQATRDLRTRETIRRLASTEIAKAADSPDAWRVLGELVEANPDRFPSGLSSAMLAASAAVVDAIPADDVVEALACSPIEPMP